MNKYELVIVFPVKEVTEGKKDYQALIKGLVEKEKGKVGEVEEWGEKGFAYLINGHSRGEYIIFQVELAANKVDSLKKRINIEKDVIRWIMLKKELSNKKTLKDESKK